MYLGDFPTEEVKYDPHEIEDLSEQISRRRGTEDIPTTTEFL